MAIIAQYSRLSHHTILDGLTFSVPSQEDFTISGSGSWTEYDLALSEIGVDELGNKAYIRIGNTINEFVFTGSTQSIGIDIQTFTISTTDDTPTTLLTLFSDNNSVTWFEFYVTGIKDDFSEVHFSKSSGAFKNIGGTYSLISTVDKVEKTEFVSATTDVIATSAIEFQVIGETSSNINWTGKVIFPND